MSKFAEQLMVIIMQSVPSLFFLMVFDVLFTHSIFVVYFCLRHLFCLHCVFNLKCWVLTYVWGIFTFFKTLSCVGSLPVQFCPIPGWSQHQTDFSIPTDQMFYQIVMFQFRQIKCFIKSLCNMVWLLKLGDEVFTFSCFW